MFCIDLSCAKTGAGLVKYMCKTCSHTLHRQKYTLKFI